MADFSKIDPKECCKKKLPANVSLNSSHTLILQSVINAMKEHGRSSMNKEVCGVLVGSLCCDEEPYLLIDARIEGKFADHQSGSVTFTSETWDFIHAELSEKHPDKKIVGWYHTHPGFGIFLSNMDVFIHENFFESEWQPAYVFDPQAETDGFFFWNKKNLEQEAVSVIPDEEPIVKQASNPPCEKISVSFPEEEKVRSKKRILFNYFGVLFLFFLALSVLLAFNSLFKSIRDLKNSRDNIQQEMQKLFEMLSEQPETPAETMRILEKHTHTIQKLTLEVSAFQKLHSETMKIIQTNQNDVAKKQGELQTQLLNLQNGYTKANSEFKVEIKRMNDTLNNIQKTLEQNKSILDKQNKKIGELEKLCSNLRNELKTLETRTKNLEKPPVPAIEKQKTEPEKNSIWNTFWKMIQFWK